MQILQIQVLHTHGRRLPLSTIPWVGNNYMDNKKVRQCHNHAMNNQFCFLVSKHFFPFSFSFFFLHWDLNLGFTAIIYIHHTNTCHHMWNNHTQTHPTSHMHVHTCIHIDAQTGRHIPIHPHMHMHTYTSKHAHCLQVHMCICTHINTQIDRQRDRKTEKAKQNRETDT